MTQTVISAIQAIVAPAALITTAGIMAGGPSSVHGFLGDRVRSMTADRLDLGTDADGTFRELGDTGPGAEELGNARPPFLR